MQPTEKEQETFDSIHPEEKKTFTEGGCNDIQISGYDIYCGIISKRKKDKL